jgi:hypothetical protein
MRKTAAGKRGGDPRIIEAYLAPKKPLKIEFDGNSRPVVDGNVMDFENNSDVINYARSHGYDAVHWPDGSFTDESAMTIFKPEQIRDTEAAFDPTKASSSNIFAGIAGAALTAPSWYNEFTSRRD